MSYVAKLSSRAAKDLDRLNEPVLSRVLDRIDALAANPHDPILSAKITGKGQLRKSRIGGWRIIFTLNNARHELFVITIERRGQVYSRL